MANALSNKFQYWSARVRNGPLVPFCHWWFSELKQLLPDTWQQRLEHALRRIVLETETGQLKMGVEENHTINWVDTISLEQEPELQRQRVQALVESNDVKQVPRFLLLDEASVLRKELTLPAATESNLQQVLSFEMDRQTPFRASEVYYSWKLLPSEKESGQIRVDLFVVPRKPVDTQLEILSNCGLAASGVDVVDDNQAMGINILPHEQRFRVINSRSRLNLGLAAAAMILLVVVMMQSLSFRANRVTDLETAIAEVQDEARRVQRLREQVKETSEAASFLTRWRSKSPMAIEILANVTEILPDDTFLDRLVIGQESVLMQGKSTNAQQLIEVVNNSELFYRAAFRGSTRLDAASGLEVFEVNAEVIARGEP
jgi:general secretion pathway protein L